MAELTDADKTLYNDLSRFAVIIGSRSTSVDEVKKANFNLAMALLNHAQGLVSIDNSRARRLLSQARKLITKKV